MTVADPGFPVGGAPTLTWLRFVKFACQNERIETLRGRVPAVPPGSANALLLNFNKRCRHWRYWFAKTLVL